MTPFPREIPIDLASFKQEGGVLPTRFGLPGEVKFCARCVVSNQRPNSVTEFEHTQGSQKKTIHFDADGVCDACHHADIKHAVDWKAREEELQELCNRHRRHDGAYDCLVPGSGGKDSFYAAHVLKYKYGMHPLTVTWAPHIYTDWGWRNMQNWIHAGFDNCLTTPNGRVHRLLTRLALEVLFHPFQPFILGQKQIAPKMSALYNIPLVFYGENEAEYGNPVADNRQATRDWAYFAATDPEKIHLSGVAISDLKRHFGIDANDLLPYLPADPSSLSRTGTQVHYLGYYLKWHPQSCYYYSVEHGNFEASPERTPGTYSKYNSIDDRVDDLHYFTTHVKFGIGRATYDASQEVRSGDITRDEGVALVRRYDGEMPERFFGQLMDYLSLPAEHFPEASRMFEQPIMDRDYFLHLADRFRSPHLWTNENGAWRLRHQV
ncbi:MAG: N-acetyl sugar amidotransferase [Rhodospirillales bacterium]|nr:MAG: N-acetyl sugar amidotransferase [Rhodospirillales bacterium]